MRRISFKQADLEPLPFLGLTSQRLEPPPFLGLTSQRLEPTPFLGLTPLLWILGLEYCHATKRKSW